MCNENSLSRKESETMVKSALLNSSHYCEPVVRLFTSVFDSLDIECLTKDCKCKEESNSVISEAYESFFNKYGVCLESEPQNRKTVIKERYGFNETGECKTYTQIGKLLGISGNSVKRLEEKVLSNLWYKTKCFYVDCSVLDVHEYHKYSLQKVLEGSSSIFNLWSEFDNSCHFTLRRNGIDSLNKLIEHIRSYANAKGSSITEYIVIDFLTKFNGIGKEKAIKMSNILRDAGLFQNSNRNESLDREVVRLLLSKESEIASKIHNSIEELLRLGYASDRGKDSVFSMISSIKYSLDEMEMLLKKKEEN